MSINGVYYGMTVRIGKIRFDDWVSLELPGGWSDTFVFRMSLADGLPPVDYARVVRLLAHPLHKMRFCASLWVQIADGSGVAHCKGRWFPQAVRQALRGLPVPVALTSDSVHPQIWDFSFFPWTDPRPQPRPPEVEPYLKGKRPPLTTLGCLQALARADCAYTAEIASLANVSRTTALKALRTLEDSGAVQRREDGKYPYWKIRRPGISLALRSWGLPPGFAFPNRKERGRPACRERGNHRKPTRRSSAGRHRRVARLWPAWLRRAWPQAQVWAGWSEVTCGRTCPDALCWGQLGGYETLFWLEVESGKTSSESLRKITIRRANQALIYARGFSVRLVFAMLGPPWVRREAVKVFQDLPDDVAVVMEDWKAFGELPVPAWGKARWA